MKPPLVYLGVVSLSSAFLGAVLGVAVALPPILAAQEAVTRVETGALLSERGSTSPADQRAFPGFAGPGDWRWLQNTFWYVPTSGLPAYLFSPQRQELRAISDQTVYHITEYRDGYFWGRTAVKLGPAPTTCLSLVGTITPEGEVLLTFTPVDSAVVVTVTQGAGRMRVRAGQWTMENQMSSGPARLQVIHWAYMLQSEPGEPSWQSLPGVNSSLDQFINQCPTAPFVSTAATTSLLP